MRTLVGLLLAASIVSTGNAKPHEIRQLAPTGKWVVDYADDSCSLSRNFGEGDRKVTVFFEQFEPGDTFNVTLVGPSVDPKDRPVVGLLRFGPNEDEDEVTGAAALTNGIPAIIFQGGQRLVPLTDAEKSARKKAAARARPFEPPPIAAAREKAASWVMLGKLLPFDLVFQTGPMDEPLAALRQCAWDMVRSWGLDVEQQKRLAQKAYPTRPSYSWFSPEDYPPEMQRGGYESIVHFRVLVDESGHPLSCHIQSSTRPKAFDDVVCKQVMKSATFHPALDAQGKPIRSYWRQTVNFVLQP